MSFQSVSHKLNDQSLLEVGANGWPWPVGNCVLVGVKLIDCVINGLVVFVLHHSIANTFTVNNMANSRRNKSQSLSIIGPTERCWWGFYAWKVIG